MQNKKKESPQKNEDSINIFWGHFKRSNIHLIGVPEEKEQEIEKNSERKDP